MTMSWNETTFHHRPFTSFMERIYTLLLITCTATVADIRRFPLILKGNKIKSVSADNTNRYN